MILKFFCIITILITFKQNVKSLTCYQCSRCSIKEVNLSPSECYGLCYKAKYYNRFYAFSYYQGCTKDNTYLINKDYLSNNETCETDNCNAWINVRLSRSKQICSSIPLMLFSFLFSIF